MVDHGPPGVSKPHDLPAPRLREPARRTAWVLAALPLLVGLGCANRGEDPPAAASNLTPGMVKMKIVKGQTRQAEVLEVFGPPDQVAHKDGQDVWTYDKSSYEYDKRSDYFTLLIAGSGGDRVRSSSRATMLILYFDGNEVVQDYRLTATRF